MYLLDSAIKEKDIKHILTNWDMEISHYNVARVEVWATTFDEAVINGDFCVIKLFDVNGNLIKEDTKKGY